MSALYTAKIHKEIIARRNAKGVLNSKFEHVSPMKSVPLKQLEKDRRVYIFVEFIWSKEIHPRWFFRRDVIEIFLRDENRTRV